MKKRGKTTKLNSSARKTASERRTDTEPETSDIILWIDKLDGEIMRLNLLYDFTSYVDPDTFRFTSAGATGLNLFIEERLNALRRISEGINAACKGSRLQAKRKENSTTEISEGTEKE